MQLFIIAVFYSQTSEKLSDQEFAHCPFFLTEPHFIYYQAPTVQFLNTYLTFEILEALKIKLCTRI